MSLENFKFTYEENEEGYTVTLKGNKEKLRSKLEAFEAFLNFKEKAMEAGCGHHGSSSPIHQFFKTMHNAHGHHAEGAGHCGHHGHHGEHASKHGHCGCEESAKTEAPVDLGGVNKKTEE